MFRALPSRLSTSRPLRATVLAASAAVLSVILTPGVRPAGAAPGGDRIALAPVDDRAGDRAASEAVQAAAREELSGAAALVAPEVLRDAQRRDRVRSIDDARPDELRAIGEATGAERILIVTVHQGERDRRVPRIALSGRAYDPATGAMLWAGFEAASGLDGRTVLGLGVIDGLDELADRTARRLIRDYLSAGGPQAQRRSDRSDHRESPSLGRVAVLPLGAVTAEAGTNAAETVTEAVRAALFRRGVDTVPPPALATELRRLRFAGWGGADDTVREELRAAFDVRHLLTGSVEGYDVAGGAEEPEPQVAVGLRLLDAATGRIVWIGGLERGGWDGQGPFRLGRIHARGALAERLADTLIRRLLRERAAGDSHSTDSDFRGSR